MRTLGPMPFDPNAAASPDSGLFGLTFTPKESAIVVIPVPFDATTSYGGGASRGPAAVLEASKQVDLLDHHFGNVYECGIAMLDMPKAIRKLSKQMRALAEPIIDKGGAEEGSKADARILKKVNAASEAVQSFTREQFDAVFAQGKIPVLLGGDHSTPLGAVQSAAAEVAKRAKRGDADAKHGLGVLHFDAHMDFRDAFEGFSQSHASILRNVMSSTPGVSHLVQIGIRDYCAEELAFAKSLKDRYSVVFDADLAAAKLGLRGLPGFGEMIARAIEQLPPLVHVTFDIDALDPSLCPHTGTPVPGGLSFNEAAAILVAVRESGRQVISVDLVEVCPSDDASAPEWDANVGARVLYKLCGLGASTRAKSKKPTR